MRAASPGLQAALEPLGAGVRGRLKPPATPGEMNAVSALLPAPLLPPVLMLRDATGHTVEELVRVAGRE